MATTQFNRTDEFLEELRKDAGTAGILRGIVRTTALHRPAIYSDGKGGTTVVPWIRRISLVATYELPNGCGLVRLEEFIGEQTESGPQETNERTWARLTTLKQQIEAVCAEEAIEVRGGELTEVPA